MTMESYYKSNREYKLIDVNASSENINSNALYDTIENQCTLSNKDTCLSLPSMSSVYSSTHHEKSSEQQNLNIEQSLPSQVMTYYYQYSQSFNSNKYCSSPGPDVGKHECHWEDQKKTNSKLQENQKIFCVHEDVTTCMDTTHKNQSLIRPPLIGWSSQPSTKKNTSWNEQMVPNTELSLKSCNEINSQCELKDDRNDNGRVLESVSLMTESNDRDIKIVSPTSSVASQNKPLEWDSLADVGYYNTLVSVREKPHSIFHSTESELPTRDLKTNLSRLNPEGTTTTTTTLDSFIKNTTPNQFSKPNAHSTRLFDDDLESKKDTKIISSVNSNATIMVGNDNNKNVSSKPFFVSNKCNRPYNKLLTRKKKHKLIPISILFDATQSNIDKFHDCEKFKSNSHSTLKRNASMHELVMPLTPISLKKSQSELNLRETINYNCKSSLTPFNFLSSSSITTIINKPSMCDKNIQTNLNGVNTKTQESKATQASSIIETNQIKTKKFENFQESPSKKLHEKEQVKNKIRETVILEKTKTLESFLDKESNGRNSEDKVEVLESNESLPSGSQEEADGGRASNSFEYFPGHVYRNLPHEENSHRSIRTERSNSTIPNTSSSLDEKLWGDSDSLLRDLERSLNILKSLINTDKYDKQIKKRLIHHVIKRLVTARYTDDKIEHNLEENVPWNPDDARNKIYCTEIIQALAKKQNHDSTEESLENWKLNRRNFLYNEISTNQSRNFSAMMNFASSEDSDVFEERMTDKTDGMQDGRRARLGLRSSDKYNRPRHHHKYQPKDHTTLDTDKSGSSECFLPQSQNIKLKEKDLNKTLCSGIIKKELLSSKLPMRTNTFPTSSMMTIPSTTNNVSNSNTITTTSTSTAVTIITSIDTTPFTPTSTTSQSSNNENKIQSVIGYDDIDWRLPATISERRFKYEKKAKLGTMSQLINYVEIEKKNQLLWINDEINHLLNLKKLLEEPTKVQKHEIKKKKHYNVVSKNEMIKDQWSSHGNLTTVGNKKNISPKKTKDDYTQTIVHDGVQFFNDKDFKDLKTVNECNTHSQTNQSDSQNSLFFNTSNGHQKNRINSNQFRVVCSPFHDIGTQTVEGNLINKDVNDQIQVITQVPINSKKETKNILNDKCKSDSPITVSQEQEIFPSSNNHYYGCLCGKIKRKPSTFKQNQDTSTKFNMPRILCYCDIQSEKLIDERRPHQTEDNQIKRNSGIVEKTKSDNKLQASQDGTRCKNCGIIQISSKNKKCQCTYSYKKSVAYELCFEPKSDNKCNYESTQLKDYLKKNKPSFLGNVEMRKQYMIEISQLRRMKREKIIQLLALASPSNPMIKSNVLKCSEKLHRKIGKNETKTRFRSKYSQSTERRNKRKQQEKSDQLRHNHLMAKIFCKKLQQKVLQGQVTLSQSISVISNL